MIEEKVFDELKQKINIVSKMSHIDTLGRSILSVGVGHMNAVKYALKSKGRLSIFEMEQLVKLIIDFNSIVDDYLNELYAA
jgi:hypothetical protein